MERTSGGPFLPAFPRNKKADVAEHPKVFNHVGLLVNEPPGQPGCPSSSRPTISCQVSSVRSLGAC